MPRLQSLYPETPVVRYGDPRMTLKMQELFLISYKECTACHEIKSHEDFWARVSAWDGKNNQCKDCSYQEARGNWMKRTKDDRQLTQRKRDVRRYGIEIDEYEELLLQQKGLCAICGTAESGALGWKYLCIDHDHEFGLIRGLLCVNCNTLLGHAKDDIHILKNAVSYLMDFYNEMTLPNTEYGTRA